MPDAPTPIRRTVLKVGDHKSALSERVVSITREMVSGLASALRSMTRPRILRNDPMHTVFAAATGQIDKTAVQMEAHEALAEFGLDDIHLSEDGQQLDIDFRPMDDAAAQRIGRILSTSPEFTHDEDGNVLTAFGIVPTNHPAQEIALALADDLTPETPMAEPTPTPIDGQEAEIEIVATDVPTHEDRIAALEAKLLEAETTIETAEADKAQALADTAASEVTIQSLSDDLATVKAEQAADRTARTAERIDTRTASALSAGVDPADMGNRLMVAALSDADSTDYDYLVGKLAKDGSTNAHGGGAPPPAGAERVLLAEASAKITAGEMTLADVMADPKYSAAYLADQANRMPGRED